MTRIRYKKENNQLISVKPILAQNRFVNIIIDTNGMTYRVIDATTSDTLITGVADTLYALKRNAKNSVLSIGAIFNAEVRKTGNEERRLVV